MKMFFKRVFWKPFFKVTDFDSSVRPESSNYFKRCLTGLKLLNHVHIQLTQVVSTSVYVHLIPRSVLFFMLYRFSRWKNTEKSNNNLSPLLSRIIKWPITRSMIIEWPITRSRILDWPITMSRIIEWPITRSRIPKWPITRSRIIEWPITRSRIIEWPITRSRIVEWPITMSRIFEWPITIGSPHTQRQFSTYPLFETCLPIKTKVFLNDRNLKLHDYTN